jgi:signal transduction histidine kinase
MKIEDYILTTYPIIHPYDGVISIEEKLKEKDYLVVMDEHRVFYGILTPADILTRPHKLVIDCLTPKEIIQADDSFAELVNKFEKTPSEALPVFRQLEYVGILEKGTTTMKLKSQIDDFHNELLVSRKAKKEFFQNLSHEVRTPLNQILGFMSIVAELSSEEKEQKKELYYEIIQKSSEQFLSTMDNLIELSYYNS